MKPLDYVVPEPPTDEDVVAAYMDAIKLLKPGESLKIERSTQPAGGWTVTWSSPTR